jgi:hypothetical protein
MVDLLVFEINVVVVVGVVVVVEVGFLAAARAEEGGAPAVVRTDLVREGVAVELEVVC